MTIFHRASDQRCETKSEVGNNVETTFSKVVSMLFQH